MKGDAIRLAALSAQIQTVSAAVGVIDVSRQHLDIIDGAISAVGVSYAAQNPVAAGFAFLTGQTGNVVSQLRDEVAQARNDCERHAANFKGYGDDDQGLEISTPHSMGIAATLQFVNKILNHTIDALNNPPTISALDFVQAVAGVLQEAVQLASDAVQHVAQGAANVAAGVVSAFWLPLAVVGGGVVLYLAWQSGALRRIAGGAA